MPQASMMVDNCTQHDQSPPIHLRYININILAQSQGKFYIHQVPIVVDYCTKYEQNQPHRFSEILHET